MRLREPVEVAIQFGVTVAGEVGISIRKISRSRIWIGAANGFPPVRQTIVVGVHGIGKVISVVGRPGCIGRIIRQGRVGGLIVIHVGLGVNEARIIRPGIGLEDAVDGVVSTVVTLVMISAGEHLPDDALVNQVLGRFITTHIGEHGFVGVAGGFGVNI